MCCWAVWIWKSGGNFSSYSVSTVVVEIPGEGSIEGGRMPLLATKRGLVAAAFSAKEMDSRDSSTDCLPRSQIQVFCHGCNHGSFEEIS